MKYKRSAGILLHPSSLPGKYGIGDIGPEAVRFIDFLAQSRCGLWQILPLGPTGYGDSPYQCFSSFAGNPYLISPETLVQDGFLKVEELSGFENFPTGKVDFGAVIPWKMDLLNKAYDQYVKTHDKTLDDEFKNFSESNKSWLDDYALFMVLKELNDGRPWVQWDQNVKNRNPKTIQALQYTYRDMMERYKFHQYLFYRNWNTLHQIAHENNVLIVGDIPIFVAHDSAEVWANKELFYLNKDGTPSVVAGVPPDYFSSTGQLWGNPLYRWENHRADGYRWWLDRFRSVLSMVDIVRLDHFRGFAGYWEVPGGAKTAEKGRWIQGPGSHFLSAIKDEFGDLPILAEDLGEITPDVVELRDQFDLPGMKILQFGFDSGPENPFLPHNIPVRSIAYTGTHDNDTAKGWFERIGSEEKEFACRYLNRDGTDFAWDLIYAAWASRAIFAIAPMQDLLELGNQARMNYPGKGMGNWTWRMLSDGLNDQLAGRIREINYLYSRSANCQVE